jgi:hypothetical protein
MPQSQYIIRKLSEIDNLGSLIQFEGSLVDGAQFLKDTNIKSISGRDYACSLVKDNKRILNGVDSLISESVIYYPGNKFERLLVRDAVILKDAVRAIDSHTHCREYSISEEVADHYLSLAFKKDPSVFPIYDTNSVIYVSPKEFDARIVNWLFQDQTSSLGNFLASNNVDKLGIKLCYTSTINYEKKPFANQLWFGPVSKKLISGDGMIDDTVHICAILRHVN